MNSQNPFRTILGLITLLSLTTCSKGESNLGSCTVNCGIGLGVTNYSSTQYSFISESECEKKGETSSCKVYYCPPTGEEEDCHRVDD